VIGLGIRSRLGAEGSTSFRVVTMEKYILLTRSVGVIPEGFAITKKTELYRKEGDSPEKRWYGIARYDP